jgi:hypothetical protein
MKTAPMHDWLRSVTFRNATALPMQATGEAQRCFVTKSKSAMSKSIEKVFSRNQRKLAKIISLSISS